MYKVYVNENLITFSEDFPPQGNGLSIRADDLPGSGDADKFSITNLLQKVLFAKQLHIISPHAERLFAIFRDSAHVIDAAGGLVSNPEGDILMIFRLDKWDLPKGKREAGETVRECAVREVEEECKLHGVVADGFITDTYHVYWIGAHPVLKRTSWFRMHYGGMENPQPQIEENIASAEWVTPSDIPFRLENSYATIRDVFEAAGITNK